MGVGEAGIKAQKVLEDKVLVEALARMLAVAVVALEKEVWAIPIDRMIYAGAFNGQAIAHADRDAGFLTKSRIPMKWFNNLVEGPRRHWTNGKLETLILVGKTLWQGALRISDGEDRDNKQMVPQDLENDKFFGREHIRVLLGMTTHTNDAGTYVKLVQPFLDVMTHQALLDCLPVDTCVGNLYNFISGSNGSQRTLIAISTCLRELLRRERHALFHDDLPNAVTSLENSVAIIGVDQNSAAFAIFPSRIQEIQGMIARAKGFLHQEDQQQADGVSTAVVSTYPREITLPQERHDNDKMDITSIRILPTEEEIHSEAVEFLPSTDVNQPQFLADPAARLLDTHFRLLRHDIFGELKSDLGGPILSIEAEPSLLKNSRLNFANIRAHSYAKAQVADITFNHRRGLEVQISFSHPSQLVKKSKQERRNWWEESKRLAEGVLLSKGDLLIKTSESSVDDTGLIDEIEQRTELDRGQSEALLAALLREFCHIQGPSGTVKSFLGVKLVKVLLSCKTARLGPIIIVCYTNHALDQFLEHLVQFGIEKVIRIGGQSNRRSLMEKTFEWCLKVGGEPFDLWLRYNTEMDGQAPVFSETHTIDDLIEFANANVHLLYGNERIILVRHLAEEARKENVYSDKDRRVLQGADIIGVTTTGLATKMSTLKHVKAKVIVCEEAGEVLEAHMLSALLPSVEHVISIGDHEQLRPSTNNYNLSLESQAGAPYKLDRSQFERLSVGDPGRLTLPVAQLNIQHHFVGMRKNTYWLDHTNFQDNANGDDADKKSHSNMWEVEMTAALIVLSERDQEILARDGFTTSDEKPDNSTSTSGDRKPLEKKNLSELLRHVEACFSHVAVPSEPAIKIASKPVIQNETADFVHPAVSVTKFAHHVYNYAHGHASMKVLARCHQGADLLQLKLYKEIDLEDIPIIALACGHFFTAESRDGLIVINRAVIDGISKRFLVSGQVELLELERKIFHLEKEFENSAPGLIQLVEEGIWEEVKVYKLLEERDNRSRQLEKTVIRFCERFKDKHQPATKLHNAIVTSFRQQPLENMLSGLSISERARKPPRDRRIAFAGTGAMLKVQYLTLADRFPIAQKLRSCDSSIKISGGPPDQLAKPFFKSCLSYIESCRDESLPKLAVEGILYFAKIARLFDLYTRSDANPKAGGNKFPSQTETATSLLDEAKGLYREGF
ncbi:hypothetical protein BHYA_0065g00190 [Botrytis hyacinthi]|uniref:DNA2/NAM7 helicase helicase domain-containing protein n=1 Tax=Botrytis hyacinthi TaxID=278943 RepID=A0A4Z1GPN3_9HELO|nr:hypothetical protein BHYA_0065g00190 [Botrytis hyacinthi]